MTAAKRATLLLAALCFCVAGCDEPDYGDKAKAFVADDAYRLSRALATADLENRWLNSHQTSAFELVAVVPALDERLRRIGADILAPSSSDVEDALRQNEKLLLELNIWLYDFQRAKHHRSSVAAVCSSREFFTSSGIAQIGLVSPLASIEGLGPYVEVQFSKSFATDAGSQEKKGDGWLATLVQGFVSAIESWIASSKIAEQNRKLGEAKNDYLKIAIQGDELFALSTSECQKQLVQFVVMYDASDAALSAIGDNYDAIRETAFLRQTQLGFAVLRKRVADREAAMGILRDVRRLNHELLIGNLRRDLARATAELARLDARVEQACGDVPGLLAYEEFRDGLSSIGTQLTVIGQFAGLPNDLMLTIKQLSDDVGRSASSLTERRRAIARRRCK